MQLLTGLEIESVDHPRHGLRRGRTQCLRHGPQGFFPVRRFDQNEAGRIETKPVEAMSGKPAVLALPVGRHDKDERMSRRQASQQRHDEAEGGGCGALSRGHDLMQGATGQATLRQAGIKSGKAERQRFAQTLLSGQQAAQLQHDRGAASRHGKGSELCHLAVS
jgi:hypothetical protein